MKKPRAQYVNGFLFDPTLSSVVLLRKNKPPHQEGLLNGIGGKIDAGETPLKAMNREYKEEAGMTGIEWRKFAVFSWQGQHHPQGADMYCFVATGNVNAARSLTAEVVGVYKVAEVMDRPDTVNNLRWLIQMARSMFFGEKFGFFYVEGRDDRKAP